MSFDRLIDKIIEMKNPTVVGLDPKLDYVPDYIKNRFFDEEYRRQMVCNPRMCGR